MYIIVDVWRRQELLVLTLYLVAYPYFLPQQLRNIHPSLFPIDFWRFLSL